MMRQTMRRTVKESAPSTVRRALVSTGQPLEPTTRAFMETRFGLDFSRVRIHTGTMPAESAIGLKAAAYTIGQDIVFGASQYAPTTAKGQNLLAHELAHTVQQRGAGPGTLERLEISTPGDAKEAEAERVTDAVTRGARVPRLAPQQPVALQRRVEFRDVGRGEQSGFARLPELIDRLNTISSGLTFSLKGHDLGYELKPGGTLNEFDRQIMAFVDQGTVIPLRLTNRHGLLGDRVAGFHDQVDVDAFTSGYVDIDDLLASTDLGLQSVLVHFLRERSATANYARRIGTATFTDKEFRRVHALGIGAEELLLRYFFGDPTIRIVNDSPSPTIRRVFRNGRRDLIRRRVTRGKGPEQGVDAMSIDVITHDGRHLTAEEYQAILRAERAAAMGPAAP